MPNTAPSFTYGKGGAGFDGNRHLAIHSDCWKFQNWIMPLCVCVDLHSSGMNSCLGVECKRRHGFEVVTALIIV